MNSQILFGKRLRTLRKQKELLQEKLAVKAGLDRSYVEQVERGKRNVTLNNTCRLAEALVVSPAHLLEFSETPFDE